jgi:hypothetical protein
MALAHGIQLYTAVIIPHTHFPANVAELSCADRESGDPVILAQQY